MFVAQARFISFFSYYKSYCKDAIIQQSQDLKLSKAVQKMSFI